MAIVYVTNGKKRGMCGNDFYSNIKSGRSFRGCSVR